MTNVRIRIVSGLLVLALLFFLLTWSRSRPSTTVILGTQHWDLESNSPGAYSGNSDFWWEQVNETTRYLVPQNGATARLVRGIDFDDVDASFVEHQALFPGMISGADNAGVLKPGTVVVFKTTEGHYGKLEVVRYRPLDDFVLPAATQVTQAGPYFAPGKQSVLGKPPVIPLRAIGFLRTQPTPGPAGNLNQNGNGLLEIFSRIKRYFVRDRSRQRNYHLEVKWVLFDSGEAGQSALE